MIRLEKINKYFFKNKKNQIHVINDTSLELPEKGLVTLLGPSGSGKTTLLNVIGGLDNFDSGTLIIDDLKLTKSNYNKIESIRNTEIGYVFQDYKLIDEMSVFDNVALSLKMCGLKDKEEITKRVNEILNLLGIYRYRNRKAAMLSGGERQRVSIARAIVKNPRIVICDEPTGNLDSKKTVEIMNIIKAISKSRLVLLVSHESDIAKFYSDQIIEIKDGKIVANYQNEVDGELNYEIANKIYLKDIKNHYNFKDKGIDINVYSNEDEKIKINLVIRNNNIYIETNNVDNAELINEDSSFELINEHYKGLEKSSINEQSFDIKDIPNKKRTSIYGFWSMLKVGWHNMFKTNRMKKVTLICTALSAALVLYAASVYLGVREVHKEDYLQIDESYLSVRLDPTKDDTYGLYETLKNRDDINHVQTIEYSFNLSFPLNVYYQAQSTSSFYNSTSMSSKNIINESDIIYGKLTDNPDEVVIDLTIYDGKYGLKDEVKIAGILNFKELVGKKIYADHDKEYTITGIVDKKNNTIYFNNEEIDVLSMIWGESYGNAYVYDEDRANVTIVEGREPQNKFDVILSDTLMAKFPLGSIFEYYDVKFNVVGYFDSNDNSTIYTTLETIRALRISKMNILIVSPKDSETFIKEFKDKYEIHSLADEDFEVYDLERKSNIASSTFSAGTFIAITLVFVILMTRASFLSRIKEVGVLRAVGVGKGDITRMFVGETLILLGVGGTVGIAGMYYILSLLKDTEFFDFRIVVNPFIAIGCLVLLVAFYLLVVLVPVFFVTRKSPAEILSRKDI